MTSFRRAVKMILMKKISLYISLVLMFFCFLHHILTQKIKLILLLVQAKILLVKNLKVIKKVVD